MCNALNPYGTDYLAGAHGSSRMVRRVLACLLYAMLIVACAAWRYQDLPMRECAWCHRTGFLIGLNRHHYVPQSVAPELRDDPANLVVLCRACHACIGHRQNWKTYNPDARAMIELNQRRLPCKKGE